MGINVPFDTMATLNWPQKVVLLVRKTNENRPSANRACCSLEVSKVRQAATTASAVSGSRST